MKIHPIIVNNPLQNIFYILEYGDKQALIIDPCDSSLAKKYLDTNNLKLEGILITHEHYDHYDGVAGLHCSEIYAGEIAAANMPISVNHIFTDEEVVFEYEDISIKAISTPGHAAGHMMFEMSEDGTVIAIFSGDVLFQGGVGHTRNGNNIDLYDSIQKFKKYDDNVVIYSGHDYLENNRDFLKKYTSENSMEIDKIFEIASKPLYFTNLLQERRYNPFLTVDKDEFIRLRNLRNNF